MRAPGWLKRKHPRQVAAPRLARVDDQGDQVLQVPVLGLVQGLVLGLLLGLVLGLLQGLELGVVLVLVWELVPGQVLFRELEAQALV